MKYVVISGLILGVCGLFFILGWKRRSMGKINDKQVAIVVLGLGDEIGAMAIPIWWWKQQGIEMVIFQANWKSDEIYQDKLTRLLKLIDQKSKEEKVSLIGTSAGGSMV